ncbi:MAG TPA: hypothetical protein VFN79_18030 [Steroidobacteraceae bacterium]|nr:hypothetical protein [Steroidobacteraceae bacterium]
MTTQLAPTPVFKAFDNNGSPLANGTLYSYIAGTTTPQATYTDSTGNTPNTNPVVLNARGEANVWLNPTQGYKLVLKDSLGNQIWSVDGIIGPVNVNQSLIPAADNTYSLGSPSAAWTQLYLGANHTPVLNNGVIGYWPQTPAEISAGVTPTNYAYFPGDIRRYGATTASPDNSAAINTAISVSAQASGPVAWVPPGVWFGAVTQLTNGSLCGAGSLASTLKIPAAAAAGTNIVTAGATTNSTLRGFTLDYTGGPAGAGRGALFSGCTNPIIEDVYIKASPGQGIDVLNCSPFQVRSLRADTAGDWAVLIDSSSDGYIAGVQGFSNTNRLAMLRTATNVTVHGVVGSSNGGSALWMQDCTDCHAVGVIDFDDTAGDAVTIEGASVGCSIQGVKAKNCGGHTASIAASTTAAPVNCHIDDVYSEQAGQSMAAITDEGSGFQPACCSITNVKGRDWARTTANSEALAFANCVNCKITGSVFNNGNPTNGTYAARESGAAPAGNLFEIEQWVSGSTGYFSMSSATSTIRLPKLQGLIWRPGVTGAFTYDPAVSGAEVLFDSALTGNVVLNLGTAAPWGYACARVRVARNTGSGAYTISVEQNGAVLKTFAASTAFWAEFLHDGTNWNLVADGPIT